LAKIDVDIISFYAILPLYDKGVFYSAVLAEKKRRLSFYILAMKILNKKTIAEISGTKITEFKIHAPLIAAKILPGQFIVIMVKEQGERIPLTVVDKNLGEGSVTLIVQEIGFSTRLLGSLDTGDSIYAMAGPMGHATDIKKYGNVMLVGGGVGIAELYPIAKAMKESGNHVTTILGAKTKALLILEDKLRSVSDELHVTTDDGSYGRKGFVTDVLKELLSCQPLDSARDKLSTPRLRSGQAVNPSTSPLDKLGTSLRASCQLAYAVGPIPMMELVSDITKSFDIETLVSLNALMVDATGMCGGCRVKIGDEVKFSCVDGPEFNASLVDWDELLKRTRTYTEKENHICRINKRCHPEASKRPKDLDNEPRFFGFASE
jgi:NAD(P)H-flavin reductase